MAVVAGGDGIPAGSDPRDSRPCGYYTGLFMRRVTGAVRITPLPCGRWDCEKCWEFKRRVILANLAHRLEGRAFAYVLMCRDERDAARVKRRLLKYPAAHLRISRTDGSVCYILARANRPGGDPQPVRSKVENVMKKVANALKFPGVARVTWSRGWRLPARDGVMVRIGTVAPGPVRARTAFGEAAADALSTYGVEMCEDRDIPDTTAMNDAQWEALLNEGWDTTRT